MIFSFLSFKKKNFLFLFYFSIKTKTKKNSFDKELLIESLICLQTTITSLSNDFISQHLNEIKEFFNNLSLIITTNQLAQTNLYQNEN